MSELVRFADACGVDITRQDIIDDSDGPLGRLTTRIQKRDLLGDDEGATYKMKKPNDGLKECRFEEADGAQFRALDTRGDKEENHKALQCFAAAIVGVDPKFVEMAKKRDLTGFTDVAKLFLG